MSNRLNAGKETRQNLQNQLQEINDNLEIEKDLREETVSEDSHSFERYCLPHNIYFCAPNFCPVLGFNRKSGQLHCHDYRPLAQSFRSLRRSCQNMARVIQRRSRQNGVRRPWRTKQRFDGQVRIYELMLSCI